MTLGKPGGIVALCCVLSNPAWSGVPHAHQRAAQNGAQSTAVAQNANSGRDECARIAALEQDIVSTKSRVDEVLNQLRLLTAAGR
jgi:hypothetical protein